MAKSSDIIKIGFDYRASLEQFEKETNGVFDGISEKAGKQKISIQLDAKNDKVIEKIKELQKLKLDKFTFEFGESGLAEQLKTFDQLEKKITEIINLSKGLSDATSKINSNQSIRGEIDAVSKLKEIVNKTTISFEDFKTIIANLPSDKIGQLNKMLDRTFELTSDVGTSLGVMTSELGKYFTITGTRSSTSFFLSNEGEFTRKPNKNKTNFVDDNIYTKGMKYNPSDLADFAIALQKQEQQAIDTAKAQEKLAETQKNLSKAATVDNSKLKETIDYYNEIYEIQRKLDDAFIQNRQLVPVSAHGFDSIEEGEKALNLCNEMIAKMKEYYSLAQKDGYGSGALEEMSRDILDVTQNIKPAVERALKHIKSSTEQHILDNEIGLKIDNSKSNAPKELLDEYISVISKINNGFLDGQEGINILNTKVKELGVTFDETSRKWVNVAATSSSGDINESSVQIDKLKNKLDELSQRYEELSKSTIVSGKDVDLVDNEEFQKLSKEFATLKQELSDIKIHMELFEQSAMSYDAFIPYENQISELSSRIEKLISDYRELAIVQKDLEGNKSNISSGNSDPFNEMGQYKKISESTVDVLVDIGKSEDEILSKLKAEKELAEANNEIWKERLILLDSAGKVVASHRGSTDPITGINGVARLSQEELDKAKGGKIIHTHPNKASFFSPSDYKDMIMDGMSEQIKTVELMWKDSTLSVDKSSMTKQTSSTLYNIIRNVSKTLTDIYTDNPGGTPSLEAREHINAIQKEIFKVVAQKLNISVSETGEQSKAVVDALSDVDKAIIRKFKGIEASVIQDINPSEIISSIPIKDTFQGGTSEASKMEEVATATTDAVQAKKDFANANERVQTSVDNSKSKLELESELMEEVAKSADKATKAKDKYSKRSKISEDTYTRKSDDYASKANQKLNDSGYTILGGSVSTELENGLVKVSAKIKNTDGIWKTFSAKIDADGNMFEQRFRTVTNGIEKLENELRNFDKESTNSTNRVVKTFTDIDIPKESFDDVIAKFNIIEEKAKNIVKITRSDVQNNDGTYSTSYTARYKDGSNEILGESSDPQLLRRTNVLYDAQQAVKESNKAYKELIKTIQNYSEVQKRIAKNEAFDGDLALAQKLRDEITELQKQPILSSTQLEEANKRLVKLRVQVEKIREQTQQTTQSKVDKALVSQLSAWKSIQGIREKIAKTDEKDTTKLQKLNEEKKGYQKQYLEAEKVLKTNEDLYDKESQLAKLELERLETNEKINKLKLNNVDVGSVLSKGDSDLKKFEARAHQSEEYRATVEKLKQSIEELRVLEQSMVKSKLLPDGEAQKINEVVASIEEYTNAIKNMPAGEKGSDALSRDKWANRIREYMDKNTRLTREFREELENLIRILRTGGDSVNIKNIIGQFEDAKFRIKEAKLEGKSFFDIFKDKAIYGYAAKLANYYLSFYDWIRYTRYAINALVELDSALLDLKKTTSMTENQLEDFYYASNDVAKQMGVTTAQIIEQASAWSRLGYSSQEAATKMAQLSSQFASISPGMETDQAQEGLVSIMKANIYCLYVQRCA